MDSWASYGTESYSNVGKFGGRRAAQWLYRLFESEEWASYSEEPYCNYQRFRGQGGIVGPDLTAAARRFNNKDLLDSMTVPSRTVSDQYQASMFVLDNGKTVIGRVANLSGQNILVMTNMLEPGNFTAVRRDTIEEVIPSKTSLMPEGLLNTLTRNEILDLVAYIRSGGDPKHAAFSKK